MKRYFAASHALSGIVLCMALMMAAESALEARVASAEQEASKPHELGKNKHVFIDDFLIDKEQGADFHVNPPTNIELVMTADEPWERGGITSYGNVFYDPAIKKYRMYYVPVNMDIEPIWNTCLALSDDGVHWEKPELGAVEWNGSKANNIVVRRQREGTVFIDPNAPPEQRYAFISSDDKDLHLFTSADGVHFENRGKLSDLKSDSQISSFWDPRIGKFVHYPRRVLKDENGRAIRAVGRVVTSTVDEKEPWQVDPDDRNDEQPKLDLVYGPDEHDPPGMDLYTNAAQKYLDVPNVYLSFPTPYYHWDHVGREYLNKPTMVIGGKTNDGIIESQLAVSRDGIKWKRYRTPYIPILNYQGLNLRVNQIYPGMIVRPHTVDQYFSGYAFTHGDTQARRRLKGRELGGLFRAEQRIDGFVSLDFEADGGEVVTEPFTFTSTLR